MTLTNDVFLRRLEAKDVEVIAAYERDIAKISFPDDPVTDINFYAKKLRNTIHDKKSWPLVAISNGTIAGWVWFARRENFVTGEVYADLRSFYIAADKRGGAFALTIMRMVIEQCRTLGLSRLVGRTAATNEAMQAIYKLHGYQPKHIVYELTLAE